MLVREWVYRALVEVVNKKTYSNLYLKKHLQEVDEKDQGLASAIFYGTLQNYRLCEEDWKRFAKGKVNKKAAVLLTMSVYQIRFLNRVPDYAVLDDANRIAARNFPESKSMVNAILHKVIDHKMVLPEDPIAALALKTSLPEWLIRLWIKQYGPKQAYQFAMASLNALPVTVRINPLRMPPEQLGNTGRLKPTEEGLYHYTGSQIGQDPLYLQGKVSVQDPGSYEIAKWMDVKPGESVLDLCAAPGTKTMAMAEMAGDQARIQAQDLHETRVGLIENDARRLGLKNITAIAKDSSIAGEEKFDKVLCDVPCSGFGILSRKPDMKLQIAPETIDQLLPLQKQLLESGASQLKDGGTLVYSTCTLNTRENEKQVQAFLDTHPEFSLEKQETLYPDAEHGGFYLARLHKQ